MTRIREEEWCEACDCPTLGTPGKTAATVFEMSCRWWPVAGTTFTMSQHVSALSFQGTCSRVQCLMCSHQWPSFTADADEMWTQNSEIHIFLVAIRHSKTMRCDISPNDKRRLSMLLHVASLTSSRRPQFCPGTWLGDSPSLCMEFTNILLLVTMPVGIH